MAIVSGTAGAQDSNTPTKPAATATTAPPPEPAETVQDLAKKLSNPVAALISVPLQSNFDFNIGPQDDGWKFQLNIQPVIPVSISDDWNVISRTIMPIVSQYDIFPGAGDQFGLGDITQSFFFSPKAPSSFGGTHLGCRTGVPRTRRRPTTSSAPRSSAFGPTAVVLKQDGPWTVGMLGNQIWSVAGDSNRADISNLFLQPFVAYTTKDAWTFTLNTESNYNWKDEQWSVPVNVQVSKIVKIGPLPVSLGAGVRYWAVSPDSGPEGVGFRTIVTFLFPK